MSDQRIRHDEIHGVAHRVPMRLFGTSKFRALSPMNPCARALFLHLICGPCSEIVPGLVRRSLSDLASEFRWTVDDLKRCLRELTRKGLARVDAAAGVVWMPREVAGDPPRSADAAAAWAAFVRALPPSPLVEDAKASIRDMLVQRGADLALAWDDALRGYDRRTPRRGVTVSGNRRPEGAVHVASGTGSEAADLTTVQGEALALWNRAAEHVKQAHPSGRTWVTHGKFPRKAIEPIREHVRGLGREEFIRQLKLVLGWAKRNTFWTSMRHDGGSSDEFMPTLSGILDPYKWDERVDVATAAYERHLSECHFASAEDEREAAADAELQRILAIEREKIRRRDEMAGGDSNARFAVEDPTANNDPEIISVVEAAEELIQKRHRRNGASS